MKKNIHRRDFLGKSLLAGASAILMPAAWENNKVKATSMPIKKNDISLAQWALVNEIRQGKWKTTDFPRIAREDFGLNGVEFVNTLFEVPTYSYLKQLKENALQYNVKMVLIMVDQEGETCTPSARERKQTVVNHKKWIDIAHYLGCHAIRTNCRGPQDASKTDALLWAAETYNMMLDYSMQANISVLIENHGGFSNDPAWMEALMKEVNNKYFGILPDWREPGQETDNYLYLQKTLPWAGGMSFRNQPTEQLTAKMINMAHNTGFRGWYGIESAGRENVLESIDLLKRYLPAL